MSKRTKKLSDDEIEAKTLADLNDASAWDEPVWVPPLSASRPAWLAQGRHFEIAAKFYVVYFLHRLGAEANLTLAQPESVDIAVVRSSGVAATIDVKTLASATRWPVESFAARDNHYVAFVVFSDSDPHATPSVHLIPSLALREYISRKRAAVIDIEAAVNGLRAGDTWREFVAAPVA